MKKYLVIYYSKTGNSEFLAKKLSRAFECDLKRIVPKINSLFLLYLLSLLKISVPINLTVKEMKEYDELIIFGPIWGGLLISPLRSILKKGVSASRKIHFALSCETSDEDKDNKYGYANVLNEAKKIGGMSVKTTAAFSTSLIRSENESSSPTLSKKVKITEENFKGRIGERLEEFVAKIKLT